MGASWGDIVSHTRQTSVSYRGLPKFARAAFRYFGTVRVCGKLPYLLRE